MKYKNRFYFDIPLIKFPLEIPKQYKSYKLFFDLKASNENLGIANIHKDELLFRETKQLFKKLRVFFQTNIKVPPEEAFKSPEFDSNLKVIPKIVGLLDEYIKNENSFNIPLTVHWNPYFKKWDIHPGLGRQVVIDLFDKNKILECIAFNTYGKKVRFKKIFYSNDELDNYYKNYKVQIYISPNYGTFIPHVHVDAEKTFMRKFFEKSYESVFNVVKNYDIICDDVDLKPYFKCNTSDPDKKRIKIEMKKVSKRNIIRSILLALTGKEYNYNNKIKITHLGKKII
tara:strand:+ start:545 stop:1399 length:855 start_codon:yes stop_codon:yes gene_type:complete